jgi:hypothetical protein
MEQREDCGFQKKQKTEIILWERLSSRDLAISTICRLLLTVYRLLIN